MDNSTDNPNCVDSITPTGCFDFSAGPAFLEEGLYSQYLGNNYERFLAAALTYHVSEGSADPGTLELVASTTAPDSELEIGSYAPLQNFTILTSDPHVVRTDTNNLLTLRIDRLRDGNTTTVGTFEVLNGVGQLSLITDPAEFLVGDVLLVVIETCPSDCSRVSTTLSVRLQEAAQ